MIKKRKVSLQHQRKIKGSGKHSSSSEQVRRKWDHRVQRSLIDDNSQVYDVPEGLVQNEKLGRGAGDRLSGHQKLEANLALPDGWEGKGIRKFGFEKEAKKKVLMVRWKPCMASS